MQKTLESPKDYLFKTIIEERVYSKRYTNPEYRLKKRVWDKKYREEHKAEAKEYNKKYRKEHKTYFKNYFKLYYKKNREKIKKGVMENYYKDTEKHIKKSNEYYHKNKEIVNRIYKRYRNTFNGRKNSRLQCTARRKRKKAIIHNFTKKDWEQKLKDSFGICQICGKYFGIYHLTLDHIYPISLAHQDYLNTGVKRVYNISDVQPVCISCNCSKHTKYEK